MRTYEEFLRSKMELAPESGFEIDPSEINPILKPHQRDAVQWAVRGGRRALFERFGLGKTVQELEWCRIITEHQGGKALLVLPLGVRQEFTHDAQELLHIAPPQYVRTMNEVKQADGSILMTNYERVRDGDIDPTYFTAACSMRRQCCAPLGAKPTRRFSISLRACHISLWRRLPRREPV